MAFDAIADNMPVNYKKQMNMSLSILPMFKNEVCLYHTPHVVPEQFQLSVELQQEIESWLSTSMARRTRKHMRLKGTQGTGNKNYTILWSKKLGGDVMEIRDKVRQQTWIDWDDGLKQPTTYQRFTHGKFRLNRAREKEMHQEQVFEYRERSAFYDHERIMDNYIHSGQEGNNTKLLILDVNGILVHVTNLSVHSVKVCNRQADKVVNNRCVFLRPYAHNFLEFCLENFDVALWSSRKMKNLESIVDMFPNIRNKLIFCWDQDNCMTIYNTERRPLHFKQLAKVWEKYPQYDESNTLLVDDDPYKAIQNPVNTGIFPSSPSIWEVNPDNELGPEGSLRMYLDCLANANNVKDCVRMNPYGQPAITETHVEWNFYQELIENASQNYAETKV